MIVAPVFWLVTFTVSIPMPDFRVNDRVAGVGITVTWGVGVGFGVGAVLGDTAAITMITNRIIATTIMNKRIGLANGIFLTPPTLSVAATQYILNHLQVT